MSRRSMDRISCILVVACFASLIFMLLTAVNQNKAALAQKYAVMAELTALSAKKDDAMWHCDGWKPRKEYRYFKSLHKHVEVVE